MKGKKIIGLIFVSIIAIICCFVIVSAIIPKNFNFELDEPNNITILNTKTGGENGELIEKTDERYNEIMKLFNKGFDVKFIEAFFQGKAFKKVTTVDISSQYLKSLSSTDTLYIEFNYGSKKDTNLHGDDTIELSSSESQYSSIILEIKKSNNLVEVNAYLRYDVSSNYSYVKYVSYAKFADLYNYIEENFEF